MAVPPHHPWFGKGYSASLCGHDGCWDHRPDALIDVHGGLTYAGHGVRGCEMNEGRWWFGFDTAHAGDFVPGLGTHWPEDEVRDFAYVRQHVESLARQLAEPLIVGRVRWGHEASQSDGSGS